jgi:alpha,alpha-trehalase
MITMTATAKSFEWESAQINSRHFAPILKICLPNHAKTITLTEQQLDEDCVIPYINGAWLDPHWLLRLPRMINQEAHDTLIKKSSPSERNPVKYPPFLPAIKNIIFYNSQDIKQLSVSPLPIHKPIAGTAQGNMLYNHLGLLYLPNAYIVPGGMFSSMYGWDSYFMIKGLLESAKYLYAQSLKHKPIHIIHLGADNKPTLEIITPQKARKLAIRLFNIAKGMVDDHIFQIDFYGGYILNANRAYYLTRSQPPLFMHEALDVYNFYQLHHKKLGLTYHETLASQSAAGKEITQRLTHSYRHAALTGYTFPQHFKPPTSMKQWLQEEVIPAGYAYFQYWVNPDLRYKNWDPYRSAAYHKKSNPRVVTHNSHDFYIYATDGVGPAPEVAYSTSAANRALYRQVILYFKSQPQANPDHTFWRPLPNKSWVFNQLTNHFYQNDREVRASGYDLSGRFGAEGQLISDYGNLALTSLLYQMGEDLQTAINLTDPKAHQASLKHLKQWLTTTQDDIEDDMWHQVGKNQGIFNDIPLHSNLPPIYNNKPYGTMFYPLWVQASTPKQFSDTIRYATKIQNVGMNQVSYHFTKGALYGNVITGSTKVEKLRHYKNKQGNYVKYAIITPHCIATSLMNTGNQWDYPNCWAPVNYFAESALSHASPGTEYFNLAQGMRRDWIDSLTTYFAHSGYIIEKYNAINPVADVVVTHGYTRNNIGFGWTNGVFMDFYNIEHGIH